MAGEIRTLIVDDEPSIRELTKLLIEIDGDDMSVIGEASDGETAVSAADQLHPEVVLLDVLMPIMDGFEAASRILASNADQRIILFSASFGPGQEQRALSMGVRRCVQKTDAIELASIIREVAAAA